MTGHGDFTSRITWETLPSFCHSNVADVKVPVRGIVVEHHGLGCVWFNPDGQAGWRSDLAEKGIVIFHPHYNPWCWMNDTAVRLTDRIVDCIIGHFGLEDDTRVCSLGGSMGGLGALVYARYSRRNVVAVVANCPVCDLPYHYTERPDLPRTLADAFADAKDFDKALKDHSPLDLAPQMPDIDYFVVHSTNDMAVNKERHSDRFVDAMRNIGRRVEYVVSEGTGHCQLTPEAQRRLDEAVLAAFDDVAAGGQLATNGTQSASNGRHGAAVGVKAMKDAFEANPPRTIESVKLAFRGVSEGHDVYNCSIPFSWGGEEYLFGRVEPHDKWVASVTMLFRRTGRDEWTRVLEFGTLELEDPFVAWIRDELVVGGTRVRKMAGKVDSYRSAFYRDHGNGPMHLEYFTSGPEFMKDVRLVELYDGRIGVFSRPRDEMVRRRYGSESVIGFTVIDDLDGLTPEAIENARVIDGILGRGEWGGCNQAYRLSDGNVLVAGHLCCSGSPATNGVPRQIYCNAAFEFNPNTREASRVRIVATRRMYPAQEPKEPHLDDCVFTSGFVFNDDGTCDIYSGLCDAAEGRIRVKADAIQLSSEPK